MSGRQPLLGTSVRRRVTLVAGLTTALALLGAGTAIHILARTMLSRENDNDLLARARAMAALVKPDPANGRADVDLVAAGAVVDLDMGFQLWTADGTLLAGDQELRPWPVVSALAGPTTGHPHWDAWRQDPDAPMRGLILRLPARKVPGWTGEDLVVTLTRPVADLEEQVFRLDVLLGSVLVVITALSTAILTWSIRRELRPVTNLAGEIAGLDRASLDRPLDLGGRPDELAPVVAHLNALLARIDGAMVRERRFSAAAAHELRTPLAGLRATLEVAQLAPTTPAEAQRTAACLDMVLEMQHLVDALLLLARLDAGQVVPRAEEVVLADLLAELWCDHAPRAVDRSMTLELAVAEDLVVRSDRQLLRLVLGNLLGNAVDHGADGGDVRIEGVRGATGISVTISNPGSLVDAADAPRVVERFWRGTVARSAQGHHCGLGLALVDDAVRVLGGQMEVHTTRGGRFSVQIHLPG